MENCVFRFVCRQCSNQLLKTRLRKQFVNPVRLIHVHQYSPLDTRTTMSAWQIHCYGGNDQMTLSTSSIIPVIQNADDILIEVHATSVNPIDIKMRGGYGEKLFGVLRNKCRLTSSRSEFPLTFGRDFSGVVMETGRNVKQYKYGDEVWGILNTSRSGAHAEYTVSSLKEISLKPRNLSHVEAASIPYVALTNWSALYSVGELTSKTTQGKRIVVLAGSGGIGNFAIQLLKAWGAEVTTSCSTDAVELVRELGADYVIDYKTQNVTEELSKYEPFDLILDSLGGATSEQYMECLKTWQNSKFISIAPPFITNLDRYGLVPGMIKTAGDLGCGVLKGAKDGRSLRWGLFMPSVKGLKETGKLVESGQIRPVVEKVFEFEDLPLAYEKVEDGHARGKIVIKVK